MLSVKKRSDLGLRIFLPKPRCSPKKKKKNLHFDFISDFPIFLPKPRCSPKKKTKKKVFTSISSLIHYFSRKIKVFSKNSLNPGQNGQLGGTPGPRPKNGTVPAKTGRMATLSLGPLLFILYINDLPLASEFSTTLFADDTYLTLSHNNLFELEKKVNIQMHHIDNWMCQNKLSLNYSKTTYLLFNKHLVQSTQTLKY